MGGGILCITMVMQEVVATMDIVTNAVQVITGAMVVHLF